MGLPLATFAARIVEEVVYDDGATREVVLRIAGTLEDGTELPEVLVPAEEFPKMSWVVQNWGTKAIIAPGQSAKEHLRVAIQALSEDVQRRVVYRHLGWRRVGDRWVFLHSGGAIGAEGQVAGVETDPGDALAGYRLPAPPGGERLREAVRGSLRLLDAAPAAVAWPLLAAVYRAPLSEALPVDVSLHLVGETGASN